MKGRSTLVHAVCVSIVEFRLLSALKTKHRSVKTFDAGFVNGNDESALSFTAHQVYVDSVHPSLDPELRYDLRVTSVNKLLSVYSGTSIVICIPVGIRVFRHIISCSVSIDMRVRFIARHADAATETLAFSQKLVSYTCDFLYFIAYFCFGYKVASSTCSSKYTDDWCRGCL
jgi:hypothetical protein